MLSFGFPARFINALIGLLIGQSHATMVSLSFGSVIGFASPAFGHDWRVGFALGFLFPAPFIFLRLTNETRLRKRLATLKEMHERGDLTEAEYYQLRAYEIELYSVLKYGRKIIASIPEELEVAEVEKRGVLAKFREMFKIM